ncbi:NAD(P)H-dependent oxidoreductase [Actinoplanes sp. M2I2]|uniref:NAD(P)H-dependent oxidoreductase n=1 Tax=Actinoplanes sp. M2I2 TaxID=1734444 RepID=UPI002021BB30|nr:NAD(P)H-dependent oxidoreductase [Actinoplanes sp. M2I2]
MTRVHVVYAHPGGRSFTHKVLGTFLDALGASGHTATVSDLYAMGFRSVLTLEEYERESSYAADTPVPADVAAEHDRLDAAEVWAFIYPVWWADCPAVLKGWFDRVWTVGFAYKPTVRRARKALVLCTAGYSVEELEASGVHAAMRTTMLTDRIGDRAGSSDFVVFGSRVTGDGDAAERWAATKARHLSEVAAIARSI